MPMKSSVCPVQYTFCSVHMLKQIYTERDKGYVSFLDGAIRSSNSHTSGMLHILGEQERSNC